MNAELRAQHEAHRVRRARIAGAAVTQPVGPRPVQHLFVPTPTAARKPVAEAVSATPVESEQEQAVPSLWILEKRGTIKKIQQTVARRFGLTMEDLKSPRRHKGLVEPRQIAMYIAHGVYKRSFPEIGYHFGGRDHTTALHAHRKIKRLIAVDVALSELVNELCQQVAA